VIVAIGAFQRWEITWGLTGEGFPKTGVESGVGKVVAALGIATVVCALVPPIRPGAWIGAAGALILFGAKVISTLPYVVPFGGEGLRPGKGLALTLLGTLIAGIGVVIDLTATSRRSKRDSPSALR
jgi:hypothetical protein